MPLKGFCLYFALLGLMQTTTSVVVMICLSQIFTGTPLSSTPLEASMTMTFLPSRILA